MLSDVPWYVAGEGGVGKSRLGLAICMSVASGRPFGPFIPPADGSRVVFLTHEDSYAQVVRRFGYQLDRWQREERWKPDQTRRLAENLLVPAIQDDEESAITAILDCIRTWGEPPRMVMFDPLISFWDSGPRGEHGMNTAEGVENTFRKLSRAARGDAEDWSMSFIHHLNKEGGEFGSVFLRNRARAVFSAQHDPPLSEELAEGEKRYLRLDLTKANDVQWPQTWIFGFDEKGAIWPE